MGIKKKDDPLFSFNKIILCLPAMHQKSYNIVKSFLEAGCFFSSTWQGRSAIWKSEAYVRDCRFGSVFKSFFKLKITKGQTAVLIGSP